MRLGFSDRLHMRHRRWRYANKAEKPCIEFLRGLDLDGKTLVDAGANWGIYSWIMSQAAGASGAVHAFEPQPELCDHLWALKETYALENLHISGVGLSSAVATLELQRPKVGSGEAGVNLPEGTFDDSIEIPVTTLDTYLDDVDGGPVAYIKVDVQGHEYDVFKGAERTLRDDKPVLQFELYDHEADSGEIASLLEPLGYTGWFYQVKPEDHVSMRRNGRGMFVEYARNREYQHPREGLDFRNYFFVHRDAPVAARIAEVAYQLRASAAL